MDVSRHSLRRAADGIAAMETAAGSVAVEGRSRWRCLWSKLLATSYLASRCLAIDPHAPGLPVLRRVSHERGLFVRKCVDNQPGAGGIAAGSRVDSWRRKYGGNGIIASARAGICTTWAGGGQLQLPAWRAGVPCPSGPIGRVCASRVGQLWIDGSNRRAAMGATKYTVVRRRPREGHRDGCIRGRRQHLQLNGVSAGFRTISPCYCPELRVCGLPGA